MRLSFRSPLLAAAVTTLALVGCGVEAKDAGPGDQTTVGPGNQTTVGPGNQTTTGPGTPGTTEKAYTLTDLRPLLPTTDDLGPDFTTATDDNDGDDGATMERAMKKKCPELAEFLMTNENTTEKKATVEYERDDQTSFSAQIGPATQSVLHPATIDDFVTKADACKGVTVSQGSYDFTVDIDASTSDAYGDQGFDLDITMNMSGAGVGPKGIDFHYKSTAFVIGSVTAQVTVTSGVTDDLRSIPADTNLLDEQATILADKINALD